LADTVSRGWRRDSDAILVGVASGSYVSRLAYPTDLMIMAGARVRVKGSDQVF